MRSSDMLEEEEARGGESKRVAQYMCMGCVVCPAGKTVRLPVSSLTH